MSLPIDVVVVTYRSEAHLAGCLASLPAVASITVVDNGSDDATPAIARRAGAVVIQNEREPWVRRGRQPRTAGRRGALRAVPQPRRRARSRLPRGPRRRARPKR